MFRCHFTYDGRIVAGENLRAAALDEAILEAQDQAAKRVIAEPVDGFEIWQGALLLHATALKH